MTFDEWWDTSRPAMTPDTFMGWEESCRQAWQSAVAVEREQWQRIASAAQDVTTECADKIDYFELPSHLMAALALALDEGPNSAGSNTSEPVVT